MSNLGRQLLRVKTDLALFALLQLPALGLSVLLAKVLATRHAYPSAPLWPFLALLFRSLTYDFLTLAGLGLAVLACRRLRCPASLRGAGMVAIYLGFCSVGILSFLSAGVFTLFGGPPSRDLLLLAPSLLAHSSKVVSLDEPLLRLAVLSVVWPALITVVLWPRGGKLLLDARRWAWPAWGFVLSLAVAGAVSGLAPAEQYRERTLRRLAPIALILPRSLVSRDQPPTLTAEHRRALEGVLGGPRNEGPTAFERLVRGKRNVVIWVLESVGERFLKSHHPLGRALTPQLDRLEARGAVRFSNVYVECPLSAQSTFTLVTGMSPPANPRLFNSGLPIAPSAPYLPSIFRAAGYHTAFLNSSYLGMWGEARFLREAGLDLLEDAESLANRSRYQNQTFSIEGRALVDRFFAWRDGLPPGEAVFAIIWNVETHHDYNWIGMPKEYEQDDDLTRYLRAIEYTDRLLGSFYDGLVARNLDRDTLIVAVGDHGQGLGRGDSPHDRFISLLVSEDDLHVPLVFLHPSLPRDETVVEVPCTLADLYPTLLDLAGLELPPRLDGASLARSYQPRVIVSRAITWWPLAARAGRYKLVQDEVGASPELYDVATDPWEVADISAKRENITQALWAYLAATTTRHAREDPSFALFSDSEPTPASRAPARSGEPKRP